MTAGLKQNSKISKKLLMTICLAAFITSMTVYGKIYFDMGLDVPARADFRAFLTAADMVKGGDTEHLYDLSYQMKWQAMRFGNQFPINETSLLVYVYPPWVATLLMPLGGIPILSAYLIILLVNIVFLAGCAILIKCLMQEHTDIPWVFVCLFIAFPPVVWTLVNGQFSLWLLFGFLGCWYGIVKDSQMAAGLALGLLLIKPYLLIFPILYMIFSKRWHVLSGLSLAGISSALLCLPVGGWNVFKAWITLSKIINQSQGLYGIHPESMHTIRGALHSLRKILMITDVNLWWVITAGIITIMIIYLLWCISQKKDRPDPAWGLIALGSLLAAPHANSHDLTLLVPCYMVLPFIRFTKYKNIIIWIVIISFTCIWGSVLYQSSETPGNLITVTVMFTMFFLFTIRTKMPGGKTNNFFS
jgi:hypothetical protein